MGLASPFNRNFYLLNGAVKKTGGSLLLAKGQLALVNTRKTTKDGVAVISSVAGISKDMKYLALRCGVTDNTPTRSTSNKSMSTLPFSLDEVVGLRVSAPQITEQLVDELIVGYNGIDDSTSFDFRSGDPFVRFTLELSGDAIAYRGAQGGMAGAETELVSVNVEIPSCAGADACTDCDDCENDASPEGIVQEIIERIKRKQLAGGLTVDNFVDITPVISCDTPAVVTEVAYDYYSFSACDTGTDGALALVQAQYNTVVIRTDRTGATSTYQVLLPNASGAPTDFSQSIASIIKGCDSCPAGYTANGVSGVVYAIDVEDNGTTIVTDVQALPGNVALTAERAPGTNAGIGFYTVVLDDELTQTEIDAFLVLHPSATLESVGDVAELCDNTTVTTIAWASGDSCNVVEQEYQLTLADDTCGADRLAELNQAYAETVTLAVSSTEVFSTVTLTGTSGTADVSIEGVTYLATFDTDLATTATNFDVAHSAALALLNISIEVSGDDLIFSGDVAVLVTLPTVANVSGDMAGTVVAIAAEPIAAACQRGYSISVVSNIVCTECDPIFKDFYLTDAPESYDGVEWAQVVIASESDSGNCLVGIRIKGKTFSLVAEESLRDLVGFIETSTKIRAAANYEVEIREGIGRFKVGTAAVTSISKWVPRTHLAGNLRDDENMDKAYFSSIPQQDYLGRVLRGENSNLEDQLVQFVHYTLQVRPETMSGGFGSRVSQDIDYGVWVEVGRHQDVEDLLNNIASNAGVKTVKAFG